MNLQKFMDDFLNTESVQPLMEDLYEMFDCPVMVIDVAFQVISWKHSGTFEDEAVQGTIASGELSYEIGSVFLGDRAAEAQEAQFINVKGSPYRRRFSMLRANGIHVGYLILVDVHRKLEEVDPMIFSRIEAALAKQLLIHLNRDSSLKNSEDAVLLHLLEGKFANEQLFNLQAEAAGLDRFKPVRVALLNLELYHTSVRPENVLRNAVRRLFPGSRSLIFNGRLLLLLQREPEKDAVDALCRKYNHNREWKNTLKRAKTAAVAEKQEKERKGDMSMLREFGFTEHDNCYFGTNKEGDEVQWSNFKLKPLFHIRDDFNPVRLFEINNNNSETQPRLIELNMEEITSSSSLRKRLFGMGDYIWMAKDEQLIKLLGYLGRVTETADPIKQLGWQREGFYAFCNGAIEQGSWVPIDDMGILRLAAGKFYLPAMSKLNIDSRELYVNEKKFRHEKMTDSPTTQREFFSKVVQVFGDNAKVGLCFYIATLFRDIVIQKSRSFPLLNAFGPKGCGKTEFAATLMNFFYKYETKYEPLSITNASMPALSDYVGSVNDALVHIDEYQNAIDNRKVQWLKDLWNGIGRTKMNMEKDKKLVQAKVDSGIILTGQEMPTADIALFTRIIYLTFDKGEHTREEKMNFAELERYRQIGATHITLQLLKHREQFQAAFGLAWKKAAEDLENALENDNILDRIMTNWTVLVASYLAIRDYIEFPYTYDELLSVVVADIKRQNSMCNSTDEVAGFWNIINAAVQMGELRKDQDFKIKLVGNLSTNKTRLDNWSQPKNVLMIRKDITMAIYRKLGRSMDVNLLPKESLLHYLQIGPEFYGTAKNAERFKKFGPNGLPETVEKKDENGVMVGRQTLWYKDRPLCFDYEMISMRYGIDFETETGDEEKEKATKDPYVMTDDELKEAGLPIIGF